MSDKHSKTEAPTPKRLRDAKKKGQIAKSNDLSPAVSLVVFAMTGTLFGQIVLDGTTLFIKNALAVKATSALTSAGARTILFQSGIHFFTILFPYAAVALVIGIAINLVQVGFIFTTHPIKPDVKRINPLEGMKNILSKKSLFQLAKSLAKLILVFYLAIRTLSGSLEAFMNAGEIGTGKLFPFLVEWMKELGADIGFVLLGLAVVDYVFQRREFRNNLKMTKQEIRDEHKEMEGNPQIRQARQQRQRQLAMSRMMTGTEKADVVITNPTHLAIAIGYDPEKDNAPMVLAKGADHLAAKIRERAREKDIPLMENKELARAIYKKSEVGEYIPMELYKAVAEILALVYRLKEKQKKKI